MQSDFLANREVRRPVSARARFRLGLFGVGTGLAALPLYLINPADYVDSPARWLCPFHAATGLYCPICGSTRAIHELLHANLLAALDYNLLLVLALPWLVWAWWGWARGFAGLERWRGFAFTPRQKQILIAILLIFAVLRNLPLSSFSWLAP